MGEDRNDETVDPITPGPRICPHCELPLHEHVVVKRPTLNRPVAYVCPTCVCPIEDLFENVPPSLTDSPTGA
jgi:hypothetical protein